MAFTLRPYQQQAVDACIDFIQNSTAKNGLVVAPTAAGKSLIVANVARALGQKVLCLQPSKELLEQNYAKYISYGEEASLFSASVGVKEIGSVTFATPRSVFNSLEEFKEAGVNYIIVDECHLQTKVNSQMHRVVKQLRPRKVIGLTATPIFLGAFMGQSILRMMNRTTKSFFKKIIHITQIQDLVRQNFWSRLDYENRFVDNSMLVLNSTGSDYTTSSLLNMYTSNNTKENIVSEVDRLLKEGRKSILVFVPSIEAAEELEELVPDSASVSSKTPKGRRNKIINGFKDGSIKVVFNVLVLSVGFDHPELDAIIHARATNSMAIYYQTLGRGVRIAPNKKDCKIVDLAGNSVKFGKIEELNFEDVENYGWGMFAGDRLVSGIPMSDGLSTTKEFLRKQQIPPRKEGTLFTFGKHKGRPIQDVWQDDKNYVMWVTSDSFEPDTAHMKTFKQKVCRFVTAKLFA